MSIVNGIQIGDGLIQLSNAGILNFLKLKVDQNIYTL